MKRSTRRQTLFTMTSITARTAQQIPGDSECIVMASRETPHFPVDPVYNKKEAPRVRESEMRSEADRSPHLVSSLPRTVGNPRVSFDFLILLHLISSWRWGLSVCSRFSSWISGICLGERGMATDLNISPRAVFPSPHFTDFFV